jgi:hypothetical protein
MTMRSRPGELLLAFKDREGSRGGAVDVDALIAEHFGPEPPDLVDFGGPAARSRWEPPRKRRGEPIRSTPLTRLRSRGMRMVPARDASKSREAVRGFLGSPEAADICTLASPVYQAGWDRSRTGAVVPVPTTFLVSMRAPGDRKAIARIRRLGTTLDEAFPGDGRLLRFTLDLNGGERVLDDGFDLVAHIRAVPGVEFAELDWMVVDPLEEASPGWSLQLINLADPGLLTSVQGARRKIRIAVIDTGFDIDHPALTDVWCEEKLRASFPTPPPAEDPHDVGVPQALAAEPAGGDWQWHGTAVAGIIGAKDVPAQVEGVAGVAPTCTLQPIRVTEFTAGNIAAAVRWATQTEAHVINISLRCSPHSSLQTAIREAWLKGIVVCASSGNGEPLDPPRVAYPAAYPEVIAIGGCGPDGDPVALDGTGKDEWFSQYGPQLAFLAPGVGIRTADAMNAGYNPGYSAQSAAASGLGDPNGYYFYGFTGTSAAAPHVAGTAGLMLSVLSDERWDDERNDLVRELLAVGTTAPRSLYRGHGVINAAEAVAAAASA